MLAPRTQPASLADEHATDTDSRAGFDVDGGLTEFLAERDRLFRLARRVTGDIGSAEDIIQETWIRWQRTDRSLINNAPAFLTTTTTRLAINLVKSSRWRHEAPAETPLAAIEEAEDPNRLAEQTSAVERTLLLMMTKLRQPELAAYVLRKGFDYPYIQIAALLRTSRENARQLVRRAQLHLNGDPVLKVAPDAHRELVSAFLGATRHGHLVSLELLLTQGDSPRPRQSTRPRQRLGAAGRDKSPSARPRPARLHVA